MSNNTYVDSGDVVSDQHRTAVTHASYGHTIYEQAAGVHYWYGASGSVTAGNVVSKTTQMTLNASAQLTTQGSIFTNGSMVVNGTGGDTFSIRHDGTDAFIENTGTRYIDIELTTVVEGRFRDSDVAGTTSGLQVKDHGQVLRDAGFNDLRRVADNPASVTVDETHMGGVIYADDNTGFTVTLTTGGSTSLWPVGGVVTIINANSSAVNISVVDAASYTCFYLDPGGGRTDIAGTATIARGGVATIWRAETGGVSTTPCFIMWGSGITP